MTDQTQLPFFSAGLDLPLFEGQVPTALCPTCHERTPSHRSDCTHLCESCLERPATGEVCGSPLCDSCAKEELATIKKLGLPSF